MLRSLLIYLSGAGWSRRLVTGWSLARRLANRFVAGEQLEDAVRVVRELNSRRLYATLDHLGENTTNPMEARQATEAILELLDRICQEELAAGASIKLTQIGLGLSPEICGEHLERILRRARELDLFVRIDMEDSPCVEPTLALYRDMRSRGYDNVGVVIQSYLRRSEADLKMLLTQRARVRLVKGAYDEPPSEAFTRKRIVDSNFDQLAQMLIAAASGDRSAPAATGRHPPQTAIATHDEVRIRFARALAEDMDLANEFLEFQMLYGIRRELQERLAAAGYPVRIYVPYGTEWYPYLMRRLAERPANLWFFLSNLIRG